MCQFKNFCPSLTPYIFHAHLYDTNYIFSVFIGVSVILEMINGPFAKGGIYVQESFFLVSYIIIHQGAQFYNTNCCTYNNLLANHVLPSQ